MGYQIEHKLLAPINDNDYHKERITDLADLDIFDDSYSYDCDPIMREYSIRHPDVVFCVRKDGEEAGDISLTYYKNGKQQDCPAILDFEDFDETKLK